jgi:hypothetical protein
MRHRGILTILSVALPLPAAALCVSNDTAVTLYFTVAAQEDGRRVGAELGPGQRLCLPGSMEGVVAAFESAESIEGCSRLAVREDRLMSFARFDRCTWASHLTASDMADD